VGHGVKYVYCWWCGAQVESIVKSEQSVSFAWSQFLCHLFASQIVWSFCFFNCQSLPFCGLYCSFIQLFSHSAEVHVRLQKQCLVNWILKQYICSLTQLICFYHRQSCVLYTYVHLSSVINCSFLIFLPCVLFVCCWFFVNYLICCHVALRYFSLGLRSMLHLFCANPCQCSPRSLTRSFRKNMAQHRQSTEIGPCQLCVEFQN